MSTRQQSPESFRDRLGTAEKSGRRIWIYPTQPKGRFYRARTVLSWFLLVFFFAAPFVKIDGRQLLQFDLIERQFYIFGLVFWPQDFHLFVLATIAFVVFIILFTAVFGRLFCGWICPQTIFMEMVFRKIEWLIEGSGSRQRKLDRRPMDADKFIRKTAKHLIFFGIAFLISNIFLAYIIGSDELWQIVTDPPSEHVTGLVAMILFSLVFYWVFAWFREQVCTLVCPYGRLQSVLLDSNSVVVAYDPNRGEPRGPLGRGEDFADRGHCIDCDACVKVCPTGIDIRNGTQLECINCTACMDACDRVMDRLDLPRGLIRYSSEAAIEKGEGFKFTGRLAIYTGLLVALVTLVTVLMVSRSAVETTILRTPGSLYEETEAGNIRNLYSLKIVNKTQDEMPIALDLISPAGGNISMVGPQITLEAGGLAESAFFVSFPKDRLFSPNTMITIEVESGGEVLETIRTNFMGPREAIR